MRLLITGGPKTGKTTLSNSYIDCPVYHTDDLIKHLKWDDQSTEIVRWLDRPGPWVIEGVAIPRSLRKWLMEHSTGLPFDHLIYLIMPMAPLNDGQRAMTNATRTIWNSIEAAVLARSSGQVIEFR